MLFMASREFLRIALNLGAAMVQIAVTNPVVIKTTNTHPGTSPRSEATFPKTFRFNFPIKINNATTR